MDANAVADQMETAIHRLFAAYPADGQPRISEYSILYKLAISSTWFIVLFYEDNASVRMALDTGLCYWAHGFLMDQLTSIDGLSSVQIRSAVGSRPATDSDGEQLLRQMVTTFDEQEDSQGQATVCRFCGHDFDAHRVMGWGDPYPVKGWMTCPEDGCTCMLTWDMAPDISNKQAKQDVFHGPSGMAMT